MNIRVKQEELAQCSSEEDPLMEEYITNLRVKQEKPTQCSSEEDPLMEEIIEIKQEKPTKCSSKEFLLIREVQRLKYKIQEKNMKIRTLSQSNRRLTARVGSYKNIILQLKEKTSMST